MHRAALNRPRPHNRHLDHEVIEFARLQTRKHRHLSPRLDLENTHRVRTRDHVVSLGVFRRNVLHLKPLATTLRYEIKSAADRGQHAECEHVDLQQPQRLQIVLVPFNHATPGHRCVLHGNKPRELAAADDEPARVLREVPRKAEQLERQRRPRLDQRRVRVQPRLGETRQQFGAAVEPVVGLGDTIDDLRIDAERLPGFAQRTARPIRRYRRRDRCAVPPVLLIDVLHNLLAPLVLEIHVDVRWLAALFRDETLEQHVPACGIHFRDAEAVADCRVRGRAPSLTQDVLAACKADDVVHRQKVWLVLQLGNQVQLVFDLLLHLERHTVGKAPLRTDPRFLLQIRARRQARRHDLVRIFVFQLIEREVTAREDRERFGERV
ncbi:hypothetical protein FEP90_03694 [Burkholderia multivorans]|nr:hypothetical protein [Burkholderia multivorans]